MQGICSLIWTNLFLLQNVSSAFDELYLGKLQIVNNVQLGVTLKSGKAVITKSRKLQFVISPQIFCTGSFACWSRVCGHIWNIRQNTFPEPLLSRFKPTHEDTTFFSLGILWFFSPEDAMNQNVMIHASH